MTRSRKATLVVALAALLMPVTLAGATAQEKPLTRDGMHSKKLLIRPYLAPTGAAVPKLGESQIGRDTALDKKAQQQDNQITRSICSNC